MAAVVSSSRAVYAPSSTHSCTPSSTSTPTSHGSKNGRCSVGFQQARKGQPGQPPAKGRGERTLPLSPASPAIDPPRPGTSQRSWLPPRLLRPTVLLARWDTEALEKEAGQGSVFEGRLGSSARKLTTSSSAFPSNRLVIKLLITPGRPFGGGMAPKTVLARISLALVPATYMAAVPLPCLAGGRRRTTTEVERGMMNESSVYSDRTTRDTIERRSVPPLASRRSRQRGTHLRRWSRTGLDRTPSHRPSGWR